MAINGEPVIGMHTGVDVELKKTRFKDLTDEHGIHRGSELAIKKIVIDPNSDSSVQVGTTLSGMISNEPGLGNPLVFRDKDGNFRGSTSGIVNIRDREGKVQFLTESGSVYEVIPKKDNISEQLERCIKGHLSEQPQTTRDIFTNHKGLFVSSKEIDGKLWFFTANYDGKVMALVNSDENHDVFLPRFFRISGSDHQFKAYPGYRSNMAATKGNEDDKNHHYVQSAKLDSKVSLVLQELPRRDDSQKRDLISDYMPIMADKTDGKPGRYLEDFKFSEEQVEFKNETWREIQKIEKYYFDLYRYINFFVGQKNAKSFFGALESHANFLGVDYKKMVEAMNAVSNKNDNWRMTDIYLSKDPSLVRLGDEMKQLAQRITEGIFTNQALARKMEESHLVPDFSRRPIRKYIKTDGEKQIRVEVFETTSAEGDILCWEMATDAKGRVYVDNIYDPTVGIDSYGTPKKKANMGMLIYKPEDYLSQLFSVSKKYIQDLGDGDYADISRLLELSPPVRLYKQSLLKRKS